MVSTKKLHFTDKSVNQLLLIGIIIVATILRFWNAFNIPFTHDELSAIFRTDFNNFHELIQKGVMPDGHPAGIQVFLYYWTNFFGYKEIVVKLPFIIFGISSVYFIYLIGKDWFNSSVGLIAASYMSTLQYPVMYSQIARPYISGLLFSLIMVYYWNLIINKPSKKFNKNLLLFILFSSLCAYNHYFSLLFAIIVAFTGLFLIRKKYLFKYIISGIIIFILFIPHWKIFLHQIKLGGVEGWLGKPHAEFIINYIKYIFNYSYVVLGITGFIVLFGFFKISKDKKIISKIIISLIWFFTPYFVGYIYSIFFNSVLQFSVLIFSFPFILFAIFGFISELKQNFKIIIVSLIIIANIYSLIFERKHYDVFYKSHYEELIKLTDSSIKKLNSNIIPLIQSDKRIANYYINKNKIDTTAFIWYDNFKNRNSLIPFLKESNKPFLSLSCLSDFKPVITAIIKDYYPVVIDNINMIGGTYILFSKNLHDINKQKDTLITKNGFEKKVNNWTKGNLNQLNDSIFIEGKYSYLLDSINLWSPSFTIPLKEITTNKTDFIDIYVNIYAENLVPNALLVSSLESKDKKIDWRASKLSDYVDSTNKWIRVYHTIKLSDIYLNYKNIQLNVYVWNKNKEKFYIDDFIIKKRVGNPIIYGFQ